MSVNGDVSEQIVRLSLEGLEVIAKLTGIGAKNAAAMIYTIMKDKKMTKGKIKLNNMLRAGKPLKIFTIKKEDLKTFSKELKNYSISYCELVDRNNKDLDGMVDVMVKEEDASRINRIVERFKLATVDMAVINSEIEKIKEEKAKAYEPASNVQKNLTESKEKPISKEKNESLNPNLGKVKKDRQLEPSLMNKNNLENYTENKPSVREEIKKIKNELNKVTKHKHIKNKGRKRTR